MLGLRVRRTARGELWRMPAVQRHAPQLGGAAGVWSNCEPQRRCARVGRRGARGAVPFGARYAQDSASFGVQFVKAARDGCDGAECAVDALPLLRIYVGECDGGAWPCAGAKARPGRRRALSVCVRSQTCGPLLLKLQYYLCRGMKKGGTFGATGDKEAEGFRETPMRTPNQRTKETKIG